MQTLTGQQQITISKGPTAGRCQNKNIFHSFPNHSLSHILVP